MEYLVTILFSIIFTTNPCNPVKLDVECNQYRIDKNIVDVCTTYHKGTDYEVVIDGDNVLELWETTDDYDRPSFKKYRARGVWRNIYKGAITTPPYSPDYCSVPSLNPNRHG